MASDILGEHLPHRQIRRYPVSGYPLLAYELLGYLLPSHPALDHERFRGHKQQAQSLS